MAESNKKGFGEVFKKTATRTKEKVLRNIGKADKTTDSEFDLLVDSFSEQQSVAHHLQKEFKNYMFQVKAMSVTSQSMYQTIRDAYEATWNDADKFIPATEQLICLWDNYLLKLNDDMQTRLTVYVGKFPDLKAKIAKRGRKLMDYDGARHTVESLESAKKRDETKIIKAHEDMLAKKSIYEAINNELSEELPTLYQSRIPTLCDFFHTIFLTEATFQIECSKLKNNLAEMTENNKNRTTVMVTPRKPVVTQRYAKPSSGGKQAALEQNTDSELYVNARKKDSDRESGDYLDLLRDSTGVERIASESSDEDVTKDDVRKSFGSSEEDASKKSQIEESSADAMAPLEDKTSSKNSINEKTSSKNSINEKTSSKNSLSPSNESNETELNLMKTEKTDANENEVKLEIDGVDVSSLSFISASSSPHHDVKTVSVLPTDETKSSDNFLYKAIAIHGYVAEDPDELTFEKGEIIDVLPFDENSEEPDEGWLLGIMSSTGRKGVFPANFTNKV